MEPIDAEWLAAEKTDPRAREMRVPIVLSLMVAWGIVNGDLELQERGRKFGRCNKRRGSGALQAVEPVSACVCPGILHELN